MKVRFEAVDGGHRVIYANAHQPSVVPAVGDTVQLEYEHDDLVYEDGRAFKRIELVQLVVRSRLLDLKEDTWTMLCCTAAEFEKEKAAVVAGEVVE